MNTTLLVRRIALVLCTTIVMRAAAPHSLAGFVYYDTVDAILTAPTVDRGMILQGDGALFGLFRFAGGSSTAPDSGTWSYQRTNETDAELTLTYPTFQQKRTLRFLTDTSGFIVASSLVVGESGGSFRIVSVEVRSPLVNCSNRSFVRSGGVTTTGFVVSGATPRTVLIRAVGPGLIAFGITDVLSNPRLTISRGERLLAQNDDWDTRGEGEAVRRVSAFVGAFPLPAASKDSSLIITLTPGAYLAQAESVDALESGQVIVEVYMLP